MNKDKLKLDLSSKDWIRCQSKSHTGRFYMFNKATGETRWCSGDADGNTKQRCEGSISKSKEKKDSHPKVITAKVLKTPAQDRLKRLQSHLFKNVKDLKEKNGEKSSKKDLIQSSESFSVPSKKDAINKLKQAFMPETSILPCKMASSTTSSKLSRIRLSSKPSTAAPSTSKTSAAALSSKTIVIATPSKRTIPPTSPSTAATSSASRETTIPTTVGKDLFSDDTQSLRETSPRHSFYGRCLRLSTDSVSIDKSITEKQNFSKSSPDKTAGQRKSSAERSPRRKSSSDRSPHRKNSSDRSPHRKSSADRSPHRKSNYENSTSNDSADRQGGEKTSSANSSPCAGHDKKNLNLKRRPIKKSPKRLARRRRLSLQKAPHFPHQPSKEVISSVEKHKTEESSSDDAISSSEASLNPTRRIGFIDKIKAICKNTFRMSTAPAACNSNSSTLKVVKSPPTLGIHSSLSSLQAAFKSSAPSDGNEIGSNNENVNKNGTAAGISDDKVMLMATHKTTISPAPLLPPPPSSSPSQLSSTSKDCNVTNPVIPAYPRGSANSRLERLRQSLFMQPNISIITRPSETSSSCTSNSEIFEKFHHNIYNSKNNRNSTNGLTNTYEPMDWQTIDDYHCTHSFAYLDLRKPPNVDTNIDSFANKSDCGSSSEYYDSVNANLMRFSAEQQDRLRWSLQKWFPDHYYFVLDTNVLLENLAFIDDLIHMKLCDTNGTIAYIPYCVLQELDKLKMRSSSEGTKSLTVRAIKYLNKKFEECNRHIHAQSAMDERHHLIDVTSADDSILNCCLHVKRHVENVVLLTEDINLRNKAICNNLLVTTKSDLISKHAEPTTPSSMWHVADEEGSRQ